MPEAMEGKRLGRRAIKDYTGPDVEAKARGPDATHVYKLKSSPHISPK